jgi:hypothetical protein
LRVKQWGKTPLQFLLLLKRVFTDVQVYREERMKERNKKIKGERKKLV